MLPPLPSTYERCHSFLPTAQISALILFASGELRSASHFVPAPAAAAVAAGAPDFVKPIPALPAASRADGVMTASSRSTTDLAPVFAAAAISIAVITLNS